MNQLIFASNINGNSDTGIVNMKDMTILCLCPEANAKLILAQFEKVKKLEFMIENRLGYKDMENDITLPR